MVRVLLGFRLRSIDSTGAEHRFPFPQSPRSDRGNATT